MKKNGPSHTVGYELSEQQGRYSLARNQCVCAEAKRVSANDKQRSPRPLTRPTSLEMLKNSLAELPPKMRRVRMPYRRFSPISGTFLLTPFGSAFRQIEFFNSHRRYHQVRHPGVPLAGVLSVIATLRQQRMSVLERAQTGICSMRSWTLRMLGQSKSESLHAVPWVTA
jgi:hypothetical protein